jgi:ferredoxin
VHTFRYLDGVVTLELDEAACSGCGVCLDVCPHAVFAAARSPEGKPRVRIAERDRCMECGACKRNCAQGAISVREGVGCAGALLAAAFSKGDKPASCDCG